ncbi:MAG: glutathione S-transferase N-terminal domain-containing protein [Gammaproteobacteria bacterium]
MIDLYFANTGNGLRAAVALEECGLECKRHKIDLTKGEQRNAEFLKINPFGAIPAIVDHDGPGGKPITVFQSGAILLYAAEKTGKFLPKDAVGRAETTPWLMAALTDVAPASGAIFQATMVMPDKTPANQAHFEKRFLNFLRPFNDRLAERQYVMGDLSVVDLALYPAVAMRRALPEQDGGFAHLLRWADRLAARPAVARGMAF